MATSCIATVGKRQRTWPYLHGTPPDYEAPLNVILVSLDKNLSCFRQSPSGSVILSVSIAIVTCSMRDSNTFDMCSAVISFVWSSAVIASCR